MLLPMTNKKIIYLIDHLINLKKGSLTIDEYIQNLKAIYDIWTAIKKPVDDVDEILQLAHGFRLGVWDFKVAMLAKPPCPTYNQFVLAFQEHKQMLYNEQEDNKQFINLNKLFRYNRKR